LLRATALALTFVTTVALARFLGPTGFGAFAWSLAIVTILRLLVSGGFGVLIVREAARAVAHANWAQLRGVFGRSTSFAVIASFAGGLIAVAAAYLLGVGTAQQREALALAAFALPALALLTGRQALIQGTGEPGLARLSEDLVLPASFLALVFVMHAAVPSSDETIAAVGVRVAAAYAALLVAYRMSQRRLPPNFWSSQQAVRLRSVLGEAMPMLAVIAFNAMIADLGTSVLGIVSTSADAGIYAAASRLAMLVVLAEFAVNAALMPLVAKLHAGNQISELRAVITRNVRISALFALVVGAMLVALAPQILGLFGPEFRSGAWTLRILVLGWELNMFAGAASLVLVMTGRERIAAKGLTAGLIVTIPATVVLAQVFGPVGAAWAAVLGIFVWNALLVLYVRRADGLDVTVVGRHAAD
jgi:O-antigen/teichoic acid export membrane protein